MTTFITPLDVTGSGPRLAVKDLIDMAGLPTTAACLAVARHAEPKEADAKCMSGARAAEREGRLRIVGKTNLHELAFGATGVNRSFGTPVNPLDERRVPGGSSSGSAVAVATDEADLAFGSDTGGSVRIPSACCGTAGLKTTYGRVSLDGVWPLAESLDTIGPMARDVDGLVEGMKLLEPGFEPATSTSEVVGRLRLEGVDPVIGDAVDKALAAAELEVVDVHLSGWDDERFLAHGAIILAEAWKNLRHLLDLGEPIGEDVVGRLEMGKGISQADLEAARRAQGAWRREIEEVFDRVGALALPTMPVLPPPVDDADDIQLTRCTMPVNLAGTPALALPIPCAGPLPASVQLTGAPGGEEQLLCLGARVEAAVS